MSQFAVEWQPGVGWQRVDVWEPGMPALRRLVIGYKLLGKRRWLVARDANCFVVWRPGVGRMLQIRVPLNSRFSTENRALLIALARQWRNSVVLLGPGGNA